jgi:transposase-like protein
MTKAKRIPTKSTRIRRMLDTGASVKDICKRLNVSPQFVYTIRYKDRALIAKKAKPVAKSSVAPKHVTPPQPYKITTAELTRIHEQRINKVPHGTWVEVSPEPVGVFSLITKYLRKWFA